jgi:DNA polymerase III epsilon subunit-like protein
MKSYSNFLLEHKFWGKSNIDILNWIKEKSKNNWIFIDLETTGLKSDPYDVQITQVACIVTKYDFESNTFKEVDSFNQKIKLTDKTKSIFNRKDSRIKKVLSFNRYGNGNGMKYHKENDVLLEFSKFISKYPDSKFVIQNAAFDMSFLNTRSNLKFNNEVIDTKQLLQLFYIPTLQSLADKDSKYQEMINKIGTSDRDNGLVSSSLSKIGPSLGINMSGYHDALEDAKIMMEMMQKIIEFIQKNKDIDIKKYQMERINTK